MKTVEDGEEEGQVHVKRPPYWQRWLEVKQWLVRLVLVTTLAFVGLFTGYAVANDRAQERVAQLTVANDRTQERVAQLTVANDRAQGRVAQLTAEKKALLCNGMVRYPQAATTAQIAYGCLVEMADVIRVSVDDTPLFTCTGGACRMRTDDYDQTIMSTGIGFGYVYDTVGGGVGSIELAITSTNPANPNITKLECSNSMFTDSAVEVAWACTMTMVPFMICQCLNNNN